jgi:hypothetical protein
LNLFFREIRIFSRFAFISTTLLLALQLVCQQLSHVTQSLFFLVQLSQARVGHCHDFRLKDGARLDLVPASIVEPNETLALTHGVRKVALGTRTLTVTNVHHLTQ